MRMKLRLYRVLHQEKKSLLDNQRRTGAQIFHNIYSFFIYDIYGTHDNDYNNSSYPLYNNSFIGLGFAIAEETILSPTDRRL